MVVSGLTALTLSSCNSSAKKELGEEISADSAYSLAAGYDYTSVTAYSYSRDYSIKVEGTQDGSTISMEINQTQKFGLDFSDTSNYYYGYKTTYKSSVSFSGSLSGGSVSYTTTSESQNGVELQKSEEGNYIRNNVSWNSTTTGEEQSGSYFDFGDTEVSTDENSVQTIKTSIFAYANAIYPAGISSSELEEDDTKFYLNSDGVLSVSGDYEEAFVTPLVKSIGILSLAYNYLFQFDKTGLLVYAEYTDIKSNSENFTISGSVTMTGEVDGNVSHTVYSDEVKSSVPSYIDTSSALA